MSKRLLSLTLLLLPAGCNMAPPFEQPKAPVRDSFAHEAAADSLPAAGMAWSDFFGDPQLKAYLSAALANNRDLRASTARIAQAQAQFRIQSANRLPRLDAQGSAGRSRTPGVDAQGNMIGLTSDMFAAQLGGSLELDFWGRVANLSESARQQYLATEEAQRAFRLALITNVAATYYAILAGRDGVALAEQTLVSRRESLDIARQRMEAGVTSTVDYEQAHSLVNQAATQLADLQRTTEQQQNLLEMLVGGPLESDLPAGRSIAESGQYARLDPGLPSALLTRRPDIRQAEHQLRAANADIGAARAAFFPNIALTGAAGAASPELSSLFDSGTRTWSFGVGALLPIFDGGQRRANLAFTKARRDELVANYERTVQLAFREVSDGLVGRKRLQAQIEAQEQTVAVQRRLAEVSELRYENGVSTYLEVLDSQRNLFSAEQALLQLRSAALQNGVALFTALGGGDEAGPSQ